MIRAALFDLDGTLIDSLHVWGKVDELFFSRRGMEIPEDYARAIAGMSFMSSAVYTKERFGFAESPGQIADEWLEAARVEYALNVELKPGTREFLDMLRARGVRMCIVTASRRELYEPCLRRNGILDMFEFVLTTDEAGGGSKAEGHIYRIAAERMGVQAGDCAVFEDVEEGIMGAKKLGMRAYCVVDALSTRNIEVIRAVADGTAENICEFLNAR